MGVPMDDQTRAQQKYYFASRGGSGGWGKKKKTGAKASAKTAPKVDARAKERAEMWAEYWKAKRSPPVGTEESRREFREDLGEMMRNWTTIETAAKKQFPGATVAQIRKMTGDAFERSLGLDRILKKKRK